jgi:hypothetical protein
MVRATLFFLLAVISLALLAVADEVKLKPGALNPAADGRLNIEHDRNGNTVLTLEVKHLAKPTSLSPPKTAYVVWLQAEGKDPEPVGVLEVNNDLEGKLKATTPYKRFDLFVTAEDNPRIERPSGPEVLRGSVVS